MKYAILQLNMNDENVIRDHKLFERWDRLNSVGGFNIHQYNKVYEGEIDVEEGAHHYIILDKLFTKFQGSKPAEYTGWSLSVSDVITIDNISYYCDTYGWVRVSSCK